MKGLLAALFLQVAFASCTGTRSPTTYTTNFPATENPISEGGRWINGGSVGLDWKDVRTTPGLAFGADPSGKPYYNDPTALLTGDWGPTQTVQARVRTVNQRGGRGVNQEVEIRLRSTISAHVNAGYEILFRCVHDGSQHAEIVRWNGRLGDFTYLERVRGPGLRDGDVIKATIVGSLITSYINGVVVAQAVDSTFREGSPGMGFYLRGITGANADCGLTDFSASDAAIPSGLLRLQ